MKNQRILNLTHFIFEFHTSFFAMVVWKIQSENNMKEIPTE